MIFLVNIFVVIVIGFSFIVRENVVKKIEQENKEKERFIAEFRIKYPNA